MVTQCFFPFTRILKPNENTLKEADAQIVREFERRTYNNNNKKYTCIKITGFCYIINVFTPSNANHSLQISNTISMMHSPDIFNTFEYDSIRSSYSYSSYRVLNPK